MRLPSWERWSLSGTGKRNAITWFIFQRSLPQLQRGQTFKTAVRDLFSLPQTRKCLSFSNKADNIKIWEPPLFGVSSQKLLNWAYKLRRYSFINIKSQLFVQAQSQCNQSQPCQEQAAAVSPDNWKSEDPSSCDVFLRQNLQHLQACDQCRPQFS